MLAEGESGIVVVAEICGYNRTFTINGLEALFLGDGDLHDPKYDNLVLFSEFENFFFGVKLDEVEDDSECRHRIRVFPTDALRANFETKRPIRYAFVVVAIFAFAGLVFFAYDWFVTNRQNNTEKHASKSDAIVRELFPGNVASQLFESGRNERELVTIGAASTTTIAQLHPAATVLCK